MDIGIESGQTKKSEFYKSSKKIVIVLLLVFVFFVSVIYRVQTKYNSKIVDKQSLTPPNIALVFGAGLEAKGVPSDVLKDRILTAIKLYQDGRVGRFIMSGDNKDPDHNEVQAMKNYAIEQGLPEEVIITDGAGLSTKTACIRLKEQFNITKAILITQKYHLRRALYVCNEVGIDATGVVAEDRGYRNQLKYTVRELLASVNEWAQFNILFK